MPDFHEFVDSLREIWQSRKLTNNGPFLQRLEQELTAFLGVPYICVMANGTLPLLLAFKALDITDGEVITTPYTFAATVGSVAWSGLTPVFADVLPNNGTIDPTRVEELITPRTRAILAVHVYGYPCLTQSLSDIGRRYGIPVIYDAAHAFGVQIEGRSVLNHGTISTLSFHATKVFNTIEGGAVVCSDESIYHRLRRMRNFGITSETFVEGLGINAKLDEVRAAWGLHNLRHLPEAIARRRLITEIYDELLSPLHGLRTPRLPEAVTYNYSHYPIFIDKAAFGVSRDDLYHRLKSFGIHPRRYFYPTINTFSPYDAHPSANPGHLPVAGKLAAEVLCLPLSSHLTPADARTVASVIRSCVPTNTR